MSLHSSRNIKGKWLAEPLAEAWFEKNSTYLGRQFNTGLCRLRIGHCIFSANLHRIKLKGNPSCLYCNYSSSDLDNLFFICPKFDLQRLLFIAHFKKRLLFSQNCARTP